LLEAERIRLTELELRWHQERELVDELLALRARLRDDIFPADDAGSKLEEDAMTDTDKAAAQHSVQMSALQAIQTRLAELQGENPLILPTDVMLCQMVRLQLNRIKNRVEARYNIPFSYDDDVVRLVVLRCTENESGGRMIDAILTNTMLPDISREFLNRTMDGKELRGVKVGVDDGNFQYHFD